MTEQDKLIERSRYDTRALSKLIANELEAEVSLGSNNMPAYLRAPYIAYEQNIAELIRPSHIVLELGAGSGLHTRALVQTGAQVTASDISPKSITLLKKQLHNILGNLNVEIADMEKLPFDNSSFDVIACAGSLSYGDPYLVDNEIRRVLRPGGMVIFVDSLNHNLVYRMNRWLHYLRGNRSRSTLKRMPDLARITALGREFSIVNVQYFGALTFAMPVFSSFVGENAAAVVSDRIDYWVDVRRSAFKFVFVAEGLLK